MGDRPIPKASSRKKSRLAGGRSIVIVQVFYLATCASTSWRTATDFSAPGWPAVEVEIELVHLDGEVFLAYVECCLVPTLKYGDIGMMAMFRLVRSREGKKPPMLSMQVVETDDTYLVSPYFRTCPIWALF